MAEVNLNEILSSVEPNSYSYLNKKNEDKNKIKVDKNDLMIGDQKPVIKDSFMNRMMHKLLPNAKEDWKKILLRDYIIPGGKDICFDILCLAFGKKAYGSFESSVRKGYNKMFSVGGTSSRRRYVDDQYEKKEITYKDIVFHSRNAAEQFVDSLRSRIIDTGDVSIAEVLDALELPSKHTQINYGWTDPNDIGLCRSSNGGWKIDFNEPESIA